MKFVACFVIGALIAALGTVGVSAQQPQTPCEQCTMGFLTWTWAAYDYWTYTLCDGMPAGTDVTASLTDYYNEICTIPDVTYYWNGLQWANNNCEADVPAASAVVNVPITCPPMPLDQYGNNPWMTLTPRIGMGIGAFCAQSGFPQPGYC